MVLTEAEYAALTGAQPTKRGNKYGAVRTVVDGLKFDSTGEAERWGELRQMERAGAITDLRRQVAYDLHAPGGKVVGKIVLDYVYTEGGAIIYEDYKGGRATMTAVWKLKRRLFESEYGPIRVTGREGR